LKEGIDAERSGRVIQDAYSEWRKIKRGVLREYFMTTHLTSVALFWCFNKRKDDQFTLLHYGRPISQKALLKCVLLASFRSRFSKIFHLIKILLPMLSLEQNRSIEKSTVSALFNADGTPVSYWRPNPKVTTLGPIYIWSIIEILESLVAEGLTNIIW